MFSVVLKQSMSYMSDLSRALGLLQAFCYPSLLHASLLALHRCLAERLSAFERNTAFNPRHPSFVMTPAPPPHTHTAPHRGWTTSLTDQRTARARSLACHVARNPALQISLGQVLHTISLHLRTHSV